MFLRSAPVCEPPIDGIAPTVARRPPKTPAAGTAVPSASGVRRAPADPEVREFACVAITLVLEALDRRRPAAQLARLLSPATMSVVQSLVGRQTPGLARSTNLRVHTQAGPDGGAEIYATFARGRRVHAVAARVEPRTSGRRPKDGRPLPDYVVTALVTA